MNKPKVGWFKITYDGTFKIKTGVRAFCSMESENIEIELIGSDQDGKGLD